MSTGAAERPRAKLTAPLLLISASAVFLLGAFVTHRTGFLMDDFRLARLAAEAGWADILSLAAAPVPIHLALWKTAVILLPAAPYVVVHLAAAVLHGINAVLVWRIFQSLLGEKLAWIAAGLFALYRPCDEALLWAAADAEILMLFFSLAALAFWRKRAGHPAARWLAVAFSLLAMLGKQSAVLLPLVLASYTWWIEKGGRPVERLRRAALPLGAMFLLQAALAVNALFRYGEPWGSRGAAEGGDAVSAFAALGASIARLFLLVDPERLVPGPATGLAALALSAICLLFLGKRLRFGLLWVGAFLAPAVIARGIAQPRYSYAAAFGAVLVIGVLFRWMSGRGTAAGRVATAIFAIWAAANCVLYARDVQNYSGCGRLNQEMRELLNEHGAEIREADALAVIRRPLILRPADILRYDFHMNPPVIFPEECPAAGEMPCLVYPREVGTVADCPSRDEFPFGSWAERDSR